MADQKQEQSKEQLRKVIAVSKSQHGHFRAGQFWACDRASFAMLSEKQIAELEGDKLIVVVDENPPSAASVLAERKKRDGENSALARAKIEQLKLRGER